MLCDTILGLSKILGIFFIYLAKVLGVGLYHIYFYFPQNQSTELFICVLLTGDDKSTLTLLALIV